MNYIAHEKQQSQEGPYEDINGVEIQLGDKVAYGDWGNIVYTGNVIRIQNGNIDMSRDDNGNWTRRVYGYNSDRMIVVLNKELLNK
jgi:hypothetical protein